MNAIAPMLFALTLALAGFAAATSPVDAQPVAASVR